MPNVDTKGILPLKTLVITSNLGSKNVLINTYICPVACETSQSVNTVANTQTVSPTAVASVSTRNTVAPTPVADISSTKPSAAGTIPTTGAAGITINAANKQIVIDAIDNAMTRFDTNSKVWSDLTAWKVNDESTESMFCTR